jgi:hypothetical protein
VLVLAAHEVHQRMELPVRTAAIADPMGPTVVRSEREAPQRTELAVGASGLQASQMQDGSTVVLRLSIRKSIQIGGPDGSLLPDRAHSRSIDHRYGTRHLALTAMTSRMNCMNCIESMRSLPARASSSLCVAKQFRRSVALTRVALASVAPGLPVAFEHRSLRCSA